MAGSYIDHHRGPFVRDGRQAAEITHSWVAHTCRALVWHYGEARAHMIMTNRDPATEADKASWNRLGRQEIAA